MLINVEVLGCPAAYIVMLMYDIAVLGMSIRRRRRSKAVSVIAITSARGHLGDSDLKEKTVADKLIFDWFILINYILLNVA